MTLHSVIGGVSQFLGEHERFRTIESRRSLMATAKLSDLERHIDWAGSQFDFFNNSVPLLAKYQRKDDNRNALIALLEGAKSIVGSDDQQKCTTWIGQLEVVLARSGSPFLTPFREFVNRLEEWREVVHASPEDPGQYYVFDAPAGYGKTRLLKHIQGKLSEEMKVLCVYVRLSECRDIQDITRFMLQDIPMGTMFVQARDPEGMGLELGRLIAVNVFGEKRDKMGLCLLFDADGELKETIENLLRQDVKPFLNAFYRGLRHNSKFIRDASLPYRVVFAGRYLSTILEDPNRSYRITKLKPFTYKIVRNEVVRASVERDMIATEVFDDFAAHLLFFSGGHPGCIDEILDEYDNRGFPPQDFFARCQTDVRRIVQQNAQNVRESISRDLRESVERLSFYRHSNPTLLDHLIEQRGLQWSDDGIGLRTKLTSRKLVRWVDQFKVVIGDDILFRMLVWLQAIEEEKDIASLYRDAMSDYERELGARTDYRCLWAVDVWYCYLAENMLTIDDPKQRSFLRENFMDSKLQSVLFMLIDGRDPRQERESLFGMLDDDEEFRFLLNYSLRNDHFNEEPYVAMRQQIEAFFQEAMGR